MNGTTRRLLTRTPLMSPARQPVPRPAATAADGGQSFFRHHARTVADRATAVPAERSIPPEMITTVIPSAATATVAVCAEIVRRLRTERKFPGSDWSESAAAKNPVTSASAKNGPSVLTSRFSRDEAPLDLSNSVAGDMTVRIDDDDLQITP